jgi:mRNA interferase HigB
MRVIAKKILRDFWTIHPDCEQQLKSWYQEAENAEWKKAADIRQSYRTASFLSDSRVVFNIKGNNYRLSVKINYAYGVVWIRFIGTHSEYDAIDATEI